MLYYAAIAVGWSMIIGSAAKMFQEFNKSVIIHKKDFENIEKKIRKDERRKVLEECQSKQN